MALRDYRQFWGNIALKNDIYHSISKTALRKSAREEPIVTSWCLQSTGKTVKLSRSLSLTITFVFCSCMSCWSQGGTPEAALEEIATATKVEDVEKHFPTKFLQMIDDLPPKEKAELRREMGKEILIGEHLKRSGLQLRKTGDGRAWEVVQDDGELKGAVVVKNSFISGVDALVLLQATDHERHAADHDRSQTFAISMRLEDGEWRITGAGNFHELDLESEEFFGRFRHSPRDADSGAVTLLRTLTTSLMTYASTYPVIGFPASLNALAGAENAEPSPEHSGLLPPGFAGDPMVRDGYEFHYTLIDPGNLEGRQGKYRITAHPVEFGKTGAKSFFTDESAVIRSTTENREANENDPPI
jgi:hypothetical protein